LEYVWVDTCCIDKGSSAELSEAINSMFRWYEGAEVCYAYLVDVLPNTEPLLTDSAFARSRWFTGGWTLQELLAPSKLIFFARDWSVIASVFPTSTGDHEAFRRSVTLCLELSFGASDAFSTDSVFLLCYGPYDAFTFTKPRTTDTAGFSPHLLLTSLEVETSYLVKETALVCLSL
jgi:hypothetical protein